MKEFSEKTVSKFAEDKSSGHVFTFNKYNFYKYEDLFYSIENNKNNKYTGSVYGLPALFTDKHDNLESCKKTIVEKIYRYIFEHKTQLLNYPRPIPDGIDLVRELIKASCEYDLRLLTTISLRNAFRKINEKTIKIINNNYGKVTLDELDKVLDLEQIYEYNHGIIIKKLIQGLSLYDHDLGRKINISDIFTNWQNPADLFCIFIPNNNILSVQLESHHSAIEHYPCHKSNTYKFLFKPLSSFETATYPIKITTKDSCTKRTYLTITKINTSAYSYFFKGSDDFKTGNGSIHLCAIKNFTDNLASIFPESISEFHPQRFELFIFEFSKFIQYAMLKNYADHELDEYINSNHPISEKCYNLLIIKNDLDSDLHKQEHPANQFIDTILKTQNLIEMNNSVSEYDFSILKEALHKSHDIDLDEQTIKQYTIYCWRYIQTLPEYEIFAKIVLLKIEERLSDKKIFDNLCQLYKPFSVLKKSLNIREITPEQIQNKANIIHYRYKDIYEIAEKFNLPRPNLNKKHN